MELLLLFLGFVLSLPSLTAGPAIDTVVVSSEDIAAGNAPLTCEVQRRKDGSVSLKLSVKAPSGAKGYFEGFDLRILRKPIMASEIKEKVLREELLAWHRPSSKGIDLFVLTEEEIPRGYVVGRWSLGPDQSGMLQVKNVCLSVQALVDATNQRPSQAQQPTPTSVTPPAAQEARRP